MMGNILKLLRHKWYFILMIKKEGGCCVQLHLKRRDLHNISVSVEDTMANIEAYPSQNLNILFLDEDRYLPLSQDDVDYPNNTQFLNISERFEADHNN